MEIPEGQIVLEEEIDENYEPTEQGRYLQLKNDI
jgi:hypothetical protein